MYFYRQNDVQIQLHGFKSRNNPIKLQPLPPIYHYLSLLLWYAESSSTPDHKILRIFFCEQTCNLFLAGKNQHR